MTRIPGFLEDGAGRQRSAAEAEPTPFDLPPPHLAPPPDITPASIAPRPPILLEPDQAALRAGAPDRIDAAWQPKTVTGQARPPRSSMFWLGSGVALLGAAWTALSAWDFVADQFLRSERLGSISAALFGIALLVAGRGVQIEIAGWRRLARVDELRRHLTGPETDLPRARSEARAWLKAIAPSLPDPKRAASAIDRADTLEALREALRTEALAALDPAARTAARSAAIQGGSLVAIVPSPALEGGIVALRGLALIRQTARLYGLRPGLVVTLALLRRVTLTAAGVAGIDLIAQSTTDLVLHRMPLLRHLTAAIPGTSIAAIRLYRLGLITAKACTPLD